MALLWIGLRAVLNAIHNEGHLPTIIARGRRLGRWLTKGAGSTAGIDAARGHLRWVRRARHRTK